MDQPSGAEPSCTRCKWRILSAVSLSQDAGGKNPQGRTMQSACPLSRGHLMWICSLQYVQQADQDVQMWLWLWNMMDMQLRFVL